MCDSEFRWWLADVCIAPSLKIIGQNVTDNTRQEVANTIRKIESVIDGEVEYVEFPDKPDNYVIAIYFYSNNFRNGPYSFDGRVSYKVETTTALMQDRCTRNV